MKMESMRVLAIVGTAGRNEDANKLTRQHYNSMYETVKQLVLLADEAAAAAAAALVVWLMMQHFWRLSLGWPCGSEIVPWRCS